MFANRRSARSVLLATALAAGITATAAGCGASPPAAAPATTSAAPSASAASGSPASTKLAGVVSCLQAHGMAISSGATSKEVKATYRALPPAQQLSDFSACGSLLPANLRQKIQALINEREAATATASP